MRDDSISNYGVDLYPAGPVSAYRTSEQQQELYDLYLSGEGAPANPPAPARTRPAPRWTWPSRPCAT